MATEGGAGSQPRAPVRRFAAAKINLYLHVLGRRPDGYHELDSLVVFAEVGDELTFEHADGLSLEIEGAFARALPEGSDNLVYRAAQELRRLVDSQAGARILLEKNLPPASGIGGGSTDAAQTLLGLCELWGLDLAPDRLKSLGRLLGADVPVCLQGRPTSMAGVGERLEPAPALPDAWLVLANPGVPISTPQAFASRTGPYSSAARLTEPVADAADLADALTRRRNDLEAAAERIAPIVAEARARMAASEGCLLARVSGSGATCFGLFASAAVAQAAAGRLSAERPQWWVRWARILP